MDTKTQTIITFITTYLSLCFYNNGILNIIIFILSYTASIFAGIYLENKYNKYDSIIQNSKDVRKTIKNLSSWIKEIIQNFYKKNSDGIKLEETNIEVNEKKDI